MGPDQYRIACHRPDAFGRGMLEETVRVLRGEVPELVPLIKQMLKENIIEKPQQHTGDASTDFIRVRLSYADAEIIRDTFGDREVGAVSPDGSTNFLARYYAGTV